MGEKKIIISIFPDWTMWVTGEMDVDADGSTNLWLFDPIPLEEYLEDK